MSLLSFKEVKDFLTQITAQTRVARDLPDSPHKDFWNNLTYEQFTEGNMPNLKIPVKILVKGDASTSNLIMSLKGEGPMFNPQSGKPGPMPPKGPMFTPEQIQELADWIDAGCPQ